MIDNARGLRYWSATFCGVCDDEQRDNQDVFVKATYFLSTSGAGSHNMMFGYDSFNDERFANNHQSGSDYRIFGTGTIVSGTGDGAVVYPVSLGDGTTLIQWNPIPLDSEGSNFRTHSVFFNDSWRVNGRLTANLGLRWDKNHGVDQQGSLVAKDSAFSPRLGVVFDPMGDQKWSVTASFAKYVAALEHIADSASAAGNPQTFRYTYRGPSINGDATAATADADADVASPALRLVQRQRRLEPAAAGQPDIPGVTPQIRGEPRSRRTSSNTRSA